MPKFQVTSGGHMVGDDFYPRGSVVELSQKEAAKFQNALLRLPDDTETSVPLSVSAAESPAENPSQPEDPPAAKKEELAPPTGEDVTPEFEGAAERGLAVFQQDDGTFIVRSEDGDFPTENDKVTKEYIASFNVPTPEKKAGPKKKKK